MSSSAPEWQAMSKLVSQVYAKADAGKINYLRHMSHVVVSRLLSDAHRLSFISVPSYIIPHDQPLQNHSESQ